jgi:hypothetical protein
MIDPTIDRAAWGPGPWETEPDRVEWEHAGLPCLAIRNHHGVWCGYAAVPPGHPLHGKDHNDLDVGVHGGLTYEGACQHRDDGVMGICHVPQPGEPDNVWWFGFDCGHACDYSPGMTAILRTLAPELRPEHPYDHARALVANNWLTEVYRTLDYVQTETNHLAEQLAEWTQT